MGYEDSAENMIDDTLRLMSGDSFAAQLAKAIAAGQRTGERQMAVRVLTWASAQENKLWLDACGLTESLLKLLEEK